MESTPSVGLLAVAPSSLAAAFAAIPDPRRAASIVYPLPAILALAVTAILANHVSVLAIAEWGARQEEALLVALGFPRARTPCQSRRCSGSLPNSTARPGPVLAAALTACFAPAAAPAAQEVQGVAIAGKAQRGRLRFLGGGCPVHALSAFCHDHGVVLAQEPIARAPDLERAEAELTVAPALLDRLTWPQRVLTGDALFCQRSRCQQVQAAGGDYLLIVKENQSTLDRDIALRFDPPPATTTLPLRDRRVARTLDYGHGRTLEQREVVASTDLVGYLDWPEHAQVLRIERTWREQDRPKQACHYAITSLSPERADPAKLLALKRGHWAIGPLKTGCTGARTSRSGRMPA